MLLSSIAVTVLFHDMSSNEMQVAPSGKGRAASILSKQSVTFYEELSSRVWTGRIYIDIHSKGFFVMKRLL